jgi:hypothetical protein
MVHGTKAWNYERLLNKLMESKTGLGTFDWSLCHSGLPSSVK